MALLARCFGGCFKSSDEETSRARAPASQQPGPSAISLDPYPYGLTSPSTIASSTQVATALGAAAAGPGSPQRYPMRKQHTGPNTRTDSCISLRDSQGSFITHRLTSTTTATDMPLDRAAGSSSQRYSAPLGTAGLTATLTSQSSTDGRSTVGIPYPALYQQQQLQQLQQAHGPTYRHRSSSRPTSSLDVNAAPGQGSTMLTPWQVEVHVEEESGQGTPSTAAPQSASAAWAAAQAAMELDQVQQEQEGGAPEQPAEELSEPEPPSQGQQAQTQGSLPAHSSSTATTAEQGSAPQAAASIQQSTSSNATIILPPPNLPSPGQMPAAVAAPSLLQPAWAEAGSGDAQVVGGQEAASGGRAVSPLGLPQGTVMGGRMVPPRVLRLLRMRPGSTPSSAQQLQQLQQQQQQPQQQQQEQQQQERQGVEAGSGSSGNDDVLGELGGGGGALAGPPAQFMMQVWTPESSPRAADSSRQSTILRVESPARAAGRRSEGSAAAGHAHSESVQPRPGASSGSGNCGEGVMISSSHLSAGGHHASNQPQPQQRQHQLHTSLHGVILEPADSEGPVSAGDAGTPSRGA